MNKKVDYTNAEKLQNKLYFDCKVDVVPASLKETYSDLDSKHPVLVSRELIVDGRPLIGIEYAHNGEVANVYTTDTKGKRVNFENAAEPTNHTSKDLISQRLDEVSRTVSRNDAERQQPTEKKKVVTPRTIDAKAAAKARTNQRA